MTNISMDKQRVRTVLNEIVEDVSALALSATHFRAEIEQEAGRSEAAFLKNLTKSMAQVEQGSQDIQRSFVEIQDSVEAYIRQFEAYDADSDLK